MSRRKAADAIVFGIVAAKGIPAGCGRQLFGVQLFALKFQLGLLSLATNFQAAAAYELDNLAQLVAIEPGAVALANIDNHAGATGKVNSIHQLATLRAWRITNLVRLAAH